MLFGRPAGKRIARLPPLLRPPAILLRDLLAAPSAIAQWWRRRFGVGAAHDAEVARRLHLAVQYVHAAAVPGDVAEFGTMTGRTAQRLARSIAAFTPRQTMPRRLHLFDSFEGLPEIEAEADRTAPHVQDGRWKSGACAGISPHALRRRCRRFLPDERIAVHAGWFRDTLAQLPDETRFALLHIDCDLYASTWDVLETSLSRGFIEAGAIVLFDDYNCNRASPEHGERRAWREACEAFEIEFSDEGSYGWSGHAFLIHAYRGCPTTEPNRPSS